METIADVLLPPLNAPSLSTPLPPGENRENLIFSRGPSDGVAFDALLPDAHFSAPDLSASFSALQFGEFRVGPEVQWLWPGRVPRGMVTLIEGAEGAGKSFVALDIAARVSRGAGWPELAETSSVATRKGPLTPGSSATGGEERDAEITQSPGEVLIICRTDDCRSAARRLTALGADLRKIRRLTDVCTGLSNAECHSRAGRASSSSTRADDLGRSSCVTSTDEPARNEETGALEPEEQCTSRRPLEFPADLPAFESELRRGKLALVVIDSLADFCPLPAHVAQTLRRLNELAEEHAVAIVVTLPAYCRCDGQGALKVTSRFRTGGARCVWNVLADPDVPSRRVFVARRTNFCEEPVGLEFRLDGGRIEWNLAARIDPADPLGLQAAISRYLVEALRNGHCPAREVLREGQQCGFSGKQLRSAAKRLGIESFKSSGYGADGGWEWWTARQWARRVAEIEADVAHDLLAEGAAPFDHDRSRPCETPLDGRDDRSASRLRAGPAWIHADGRLEQAVTIRADEFVAQCQARDAEIVQATTRKPDAVAPALPVSPQPAVLSYAARATAAAKSPAASSKNEESLEKQGEFQRPADGPLPRDGYARRQERKRRQRERENARKRAGAR